MFCFFRLLLNHSFACMYVPASRPPPTSLLELFGIEKSISLLGCHHKQTNWRLGIYVKLQQKLSDELCFKRGYDFVHLFLRQLVENGRRRLIFLRLNLGSLDGFANQFGELFVEVKGSPIFELAMLGLEHSKG